MSNSGSHINEINLIDQRISALDEDRNQLLQRKQKLVNSPQTQQSKSHLTTAQKVSIFKNRFRGRNDIYATRWQNAQGRSGYSVACNNEWVRGVCNKPKIKCHECPSREYKTLDEQAIYGHLSGKDVLGLYPLLNDNTCYLLAADFDKDGWQFAVSAMAQACVFFEIPYAIEISRSGNGAHLWVFFSEPVQARDARSLGFGLLDKAMEIHPDLSFTSYDRLFPNQAIMPEGGFGNLIALPLQYLARQQGNSQFVDNDLEPYSDQWGFIASIETVSRKQLDSLLAQVVPNSLNVMEQTAVDTRPPWEQGAKTKLELIENCPKEVTVTLANHVYFKLDEIPAPLAARLKRLASFSNPVFFKTQALRFSTHGTPRFISCAKIEQGYLSLPRGCFDDAKALLEEHDITPIIDDKRENGEKIKALTFLGNLRKDQSKAVLALAKHNTGILHAPTAFGKTVAAIGLIAKRRTNTLILTHSRQLLDQWKARLQAFLQGADIGIIGGGKKNPSHQIDIATYQSLINKKDNTIDPIIQEYGQVIIDECHHISAPRFEMVLNEVRAKYVLGLTATPDRQDGHQKIIFMLAGPIRHKVAINHADKFEQKVIVRQLYNQPPAELTSKEERPHIHNVYQWISSSENRNQQIIADVINEIKKGKHPLILTERREHAETLHQLLIEKGIQSVILRGAMRAKERNAANEQLPSAQAVVATGRYVGEGFDLPRLDTLFLSMPIAWKGSLAQYAGRIHRESAGKDCVTIFDYVDVSLPMLQRMFNKREKGYKNMGYTIGYSDSKDAVISNDQLTLLPVKSNVEEPVSG